MKRFTIAILLGLLLLDCVDYYGKQPWHPRDPSRWDRGDHTRHR